MRPYAAVVACARPDPSLPAVRALRLLPRAERPRRILLAVGRNPSAQRNAAARALREPLLYFLDDDSCPQGGTATRLASHFTDPRTLAAGGPNLTPPDSPPFQKSVGSVLASWIGSFRVRHRYAALGSVKEATEKDLILCNLMVQREGFLKEGGFREDLYPNEENEFLNRVLHRGWRLVYDPAAAVLRPRRENTASFVRQAFRYGWGRGRQIRVYPCLTDVVHGVPAAFLIYLAALPFLLFEGALPPALRSLSVGPLALFVLLCAGTGAAAASWNRQAADFFRVPLLILLRHAAYGTGLLCGLLGPAPVAHDAAAELFEVRDGHLRRVLKDRGR